MSKRIDCGPVWDRTCRADALLNDLNEARALVRRLVEVVDDPDFIHGCDTVDLHESPPCNNCYPCLGRIALHDARAALKGWDGK